VEGHIAGDGGGRDGGDPPVQGRWHIDLMAANHQQLLLAGVLPAHIFDCGVTTADDDYFSDRSARPCGRFALFARLTAHAP